MINSRWAAFSWKHAAAHSVSGGLGFDARHRMAGSMKGSRVSFCCLLETQHRARSPRVSLPFSVFFCGRICSIHLSFLL